LAGLCGGELLHSLHPARCRHNNNLLTAGRPKHIILLALPDVANWPILRPHKKVQSKNVSGRTSLGRNFSAIFSQKRPKRGRIFKMFCFLYFFPHMKHKKNLEFSQILVLVWFQKFCHILMK
jgi:hypothetical protein